jgi:MinD superfamily P-loop ATPase
MKPKELVIISGKGGTGKTSVTAAFAALAQNAVVADCDVDAADLHLVLRPEVRHQEEFESGRLAVIDQKACFRCGMCLAYCRFGAVSWSPSEEGPPVYEIDPLACEGCGVCAYLCNAGAIEMEDRTVGVWMRSDTPYGPMVHARLGIAAENSGKLVTKVRQEARALAESLGAGLILTDGPPGIGCPVIASVTGADHVLVVTEPTVSGLHDFERVTALARHFQIPVMLCVNKWDLNLEVTEKLEAQARSLGAVPVGRVRYDPSVTRAQIEERPVVELDDAPAAADLRDLWINVGKQLHLPAAVAAAIP